MNKNQIEGLGKTIAGKIQQGAGKLVGSKSQQAKGLRKQAEGKAEKKLGDTKEMLKLISSMSKIYPVDFEFAKEAGSIHASIRKHIKDFGLADAFVLLKARKLKAKIITGDPHFKDCKEALLIK